MHKTTAKLQPPATIFLCPSVLTFGHIRPPLRHSHSPRIFLFLAQNFLPQLLNQGADPNSRRSYGSALLHVAVARGQTEIAQALLEAGADVNARDHYTGHPRVSAWTVRQATSEFHSPPQHVLAAHHLQDISARLQDFGHFGIFALAAVGLTPLHYAALTDNFAMLQLLISYRADPTLTSLEGRRHPAGETNTWSSTCPGPSSSLRLPHLNFF